MEPLIPLPCPLPRYGFRIRPVLTNARFGILMIRCCFTESGKLVFRCNVSEGTAVQINSRYFCCMKVIGNLIVPDELHSACFSCDLNQCKGACCVEGDAGAPLTEEEISLLEDYIDRVFPFMEPEGRKIVGYNGVFDWDMEGQYVTPLVNDRECAFAIFREGIALCAIEQAHAAGVIPLQKPESCHLYPLRLKKMENGMTRIYYHQWHICEPARENGQKKGIKLIDFLEKALVNKFGKEWLEKR